MKLTGKS